MENEFELPDYYNTKKPKEKQDLVKRKCFACGKEKAIKYPMTTTLNCLVLDNSL